MGLCAELVGNRARHSFEELDEIWRILETKVIANLLDAERGVLKLSFGLESYAVIDELKGGDVCTLVDILA